MAKITLRDYLGGIEELIEKGDNNEALAHCRHILKSIPKHIDTYRLMGKAYLEEKRYDDARDLFQRVLSSMPDDFVAHIGMSIVFENESNDEAAIWHMERAFESQPSNRAIQEELRRLYGKRDGRAPAKVRLTRGALARMYAHGDLYSQAISELRNALKEDAKRPDLLVLLADMYYGTQQSNDAIRVCEQLLESLPYCLFANHLMARILIDSGRAHESHPYTERVEELDPYAADAVNLADKDQVPAQRVMIEHLIIETGDLDVQEIPRSWTGALEPLLENRPEFVKEELPEWLSVQPEDIPEAETKPVAGTAEEDLRVLTTSELKNLQELAPDAPERAESQPSMSDTQPFETGAGGSKELPSWLKELRPDGPGEEGADEEEVAASGQEVGAAVTQPTLGGEGEEEEEDGLAWMDTLPSQQAPEGETPTPGAEESAAEEVAPEVSEAPETEEDSSLDWLDKLGGEEEQPEADAEEGGEEAAVPDQEMGIGVTKPVAFADEELESPAEEPTKQEGPEPEQEGEQAKAFASDEAEGGGESETPDWLKDLAAEVDQSTKPVEGRAAKAFEEPPDWLDELRPEGEAAESEEGIEEARVESAEEPEEEIEEIEIPRLEWLDTLKQKKEEEGAQSEEAAEGKASEWVPETALGEESGEAPSAEVAAEDDVQSLREGLADAEAAPETSEATVPSEVRAQEEESEQALKGARQALNAGNFEGAAEDYKKLVKHGKFVDEAIEDLEDAAGRHPDQMVLWQTLGDAYMRADRLRDALDSYTKAEGLL